MISVAFALIYFAVRAQHWNVLLTCSTVAPERKDRAGSAFSASVSLIRVAGFRRGGGRVNWVGMSQRFVRYDGTRRGPPILDTAPKHWTTRRLENITEI